MKKHLGFRTIPEGAEFDKFRLTLCGLDTRPILASMVVYVEKATCQACIEKYMDGLAFMRENGLIIGDESIQNLPSILLHGQGEDILRY